MLVKGDPDQAAGPEGSVDATGATVMDLPGTTLMPGLVEGHSHILLHAYNETPWNDQVAHEGLALRAARAVNHLHATLMARASTTVRDTQERTGAGYADVELKQAVTQGIVPGPRVLASTRAIVATGSYAPKGFAPEWTHVPQGAEEADGVDSLIRVVRDQIGHGADWIKLYGDYRWGPHPGSYTSPTFSLEEMKLFSRDSENVRRCLLGRSYQHSRGHAPRDPRRCAETIEHGNDGTAETWKLMVEHHVALCPTPGRRRRHHAVFRMEKGTPEPQGTRSKARQLQGSARRRSYDPKRQRRRRVSARR